MEISEIAGQMFQRLLRDGVRPSDSAALPDGRWDWTTLRRRILDSSANKQRARSKIDISERTFGNWKAGKPTDNTTVEAMAEVFFGDDAALAAEKRKFLAIWPRKGKPVPNERVAEARDAEGTEVSEFLCVRLVQSHPRLGERL